MDTHVAYLLGWDDDPTVREQQLSIPVIGIAKTGEWCPMPTSANIKSSGTVLPLRKIEAPPHPQFRHAPHFALEVGDDAMNAATPVPLLRGMTAVCVDLSEEPVPIEDGRIYALRTLGEVTTHIVIRRAVLRSHGFELRAESTTPEKYPPLLFTGKAITGTNPSCQWGLVYRLMFDMT